MGRMPRLSLTVAACALLALVADVGVHAQKEPKIRTSRFQNLPARIYYFDDTPNMLYHDGIAGVLHYSSDEGNIWKPVDAIPKGDAVSLVEHPFDNDVAFVMGPAKKHYRTRDRGKTWQSFETPYAADFRDTPLSFHVDPEYKEHVLFTGVECSNRIFYKVCHTATFLTKDLFSSESKKILINTKKCLFAHSSKEFKHEAHKKLIFCHAYDSQTSNGEYTLESSRIVTSEDFFESDKKIVDLGLAGGEKEARGVLAIAVVNKFMVVARRDLKAASNSPTNMHLHVSNDAKTWAYAHFPHASSSMLRENAYTLLPGTTHSLAVDVLLSQHESIGTLFTSNSNGTYFVESLSNTNRNGQGFVDFETVYGVEGVALANVVANADKPGVGKTLDKLLRSKLTFDGGATWHHIKPPERDMSNRNYCDGNKPDECSLHFHSVTNPHNFGRIFSSPSPGYLFGVGSVGPHLAPYGECSTFLSTDGGQTWKQVAAYPTKYEFGGRGTVLVQVSDLDGAYVNEVSYSLDSGESWKSITTSEHFRAKALLTVPDSTSGKFFLVGTLNTTVKAGEAPHIAIMLDFSETWERKCEDDKDFEKWYARSGTGSECVLGHKQYYTRRKTNAKCWVGHKWEDPVSIEESCSCVDADYECDYNFVRSGKDKECEPAGPLAIPAGKCLTGDSKETFLGSSGYRKIAGNTCTGGVRDKPVARPCKLGQPESGSIIHTSMEFPTAIRQNDFFKSSNTVLVLLDDGTLYQSSNEGYTWVHNLSPHKFAGLYMHPYSHSRAYLVTTTGDGFHTVNGGESWEAFKFPSKPNMFRVPALTFHPLESDYLIWTGSKGCDSSFGDCSAEAQYSTDNGRNWRLVDNYIRNCQWARDTNLKIDRKQILCESYKEKKGDQRTFKVDERNPLRLVTGTPFFEKKTAVFEHVVGFAKFAEYLLVAEYQPKKQALDLQVSLDGKEFATGMFPPSMRPDNHAYTILESSTDSVFLHLTMSDVTDAKFGNILKSNSNGTYYSLSIEHVSRNNEGYVDFEKMQTLEGIALVNVVANPHDAPVVRKKNIQTRITHNDGGTWKALNPPAKDSLGQQYKCTNTSCGLQFHGFTERYDVRATYSSPAIPGVMMAVGNVGESLLPYEESDTFLSLDGGFEWEEIAKGAHLWEFGDSGSIVVIVNDEGPTDFVKYSTNQGLTWTEYNFGIRMRVLSIRNRPNDTSRKFILLGHVPGSASSALAIHLDFSQLIQKKCVLNLEDENNDDFELWSPAEIRSEKCLFGRQTQYHRRIRDHECYVGDTPLQNATVVSNCACSEVDFECEFNYMRDPQGKCVPVPGAKLLPLDTSYETCRGDALYWYERTAYRKIKHSSCEGGSTIHQGDRHDCPGIRSHGFWFWAFMALIVVGLTALFSMWWRKSPYATGAIRLPDGPQRPYRRSFEDSGPLATLASIPWFIVGMAGVAWSHISPLVDRLPFVGRSRATGGYRTVAVDEDARVLRFEDEE